MTKIKFRFVVAFILLLLSSACRSHGIGEPCTTTGSGFFMSHSCKTLCMSLWTIKCPNGETGDSHVCGGELNCSRGSCPQDQVCYQTNFDRSVCVSQNICSEWKNPDLHPKVKLGKFKENPATLVPTKAITK